MKNYFLSKNLVQIHFTNFKKTIYFNRQSGKVFCRSKINTISDVKHPGVYIGKDAMGTEWFMHNHYESGRPAFITKEQFAKGQPLKHIPINTNKSSLGIIENGLRQILQAKSYSAIWYNCQHFVNIATSNKNASEDVQKWTAIAATALLIFGANKG